MALPGNETSIFRKRPRVQLSPNFSASNPNLQLVFIGQTVKDSDSGTFVHQQGDTATIYRNPIQIALTYSLGCSQLSLDQRLQTEEQLLAFFFDHKAIAPVVPSSFREIPELYQRLNMKAELRPIASAGLTAIGSFQISFEYLALFHSGNPLREERRVENRVIHYNQPTKGAHDGRRI